MVDPRKVLQIRTIVYPTDFSELSLQALNHAVTLAEKFDSRLHCIHVVELVSQYWMAMDSGVVPATPPIEDLLAAARKQMKEFIAEYISSDFSVISDVLTGRTFLEIIQYARRVNADLIVMGTHGRSAIRQMLMGSVADKVVHKAPCAVLTVRDPGHVFEMP